MKNNSSEIKLKEQEDKGNDLELKRRAFFDKIEKYREKEKNYNEEKVRLNNLLQELNDKLDLSIKKDEEDYLAYFKKEAGEQKIAKAQSTTGLLDEEIKKETKDEKKDYEQKETPQENVEVERTTNQDEEKTEIAIDGGQEVTVLKEPLEIKIEEVINENVSTEEKKELQKEFPDQDIEEVIENEVVEQMNDKAIILVEKRQKEDLLKRAARKVKNNFLAILVSTSIFSPTSISKTPESKADVISYNNIKVENLKDWEKINLYEDEINKLENISIITKANENSNNKYLIIDKQNGKIHRYQGDSLIKSYNVCLGDSIGDEQTILKSTYKKVAEDQYYGPNVSIEEATYTENGERYLRDGYEAFTAWSKGNMKTGAGTYTISNKGPFLKNKGIFLKNERGIQVSTSIHFNSHLKTYAPDFRFTNGCIGCDQLTIDELYEIMSIGENVYILPDNPHNKFQIVDGELKFLSNQQNVNKTLRPYKPKPIILQAKNPNENTKIWLMTLSENKTKLMGLYPTISNDIYNELAKIAYGIMGQESTFGTYGGPRGQYGRVRDVASSAVGFSPSVGPGQVRLENVDPKIRKAFNMQKNDDLFDIKTCAIATMSILMDNYLYISYNNKEDQYKKLVILKYNAALEAKRITKENKTLEQLGPKARGYIKKVLNYSELAKVYTADENDNYKHPGWDYGQPNNLAMNNINN